MIDQLCERIYEKCKGVGVGHLVWAPVPQLEEVPRILEVERARSEDHYATKFSIVQMDAEHFKQRQKLPVKLLALGDTEELLIAKAKKRPCVILSADNTDIADAAAAKELARRKHLRDQAMVLAPIYGIATGDMPQGFPPIMTARIQAFLYSQFFFLPKSCPKTGLGMDKEGILRLDRVFSATPTRGVHPMDIKLADEPLMLLLAQLRERFSGIEDESLKMVRELLREQLPAEARPAAAEKG